MSMMPSRCSVPLSCDASSPHFLDNDVDYLDSDVAVEVIAAAALVASPLSEGRQEHLFVRAGFLLWGGRVEMADDVTCDSWLNRRSADRAGTERVDVGRW